MKENQKININEILRREDEIINGPKLPLGRLMVREAAKRHGLPESRFCRHHVIPKSMRGVGIRVNGEVFNPTPREINCQHNRVPVLEGEHALGHWICALVFRADGHFGLASDHFHTAKALLSRPGVTDDDKLKFVTLGILGGCLITNHFGVPGQRRNWGRESG